MTPETRIQGSDISERERDLLKSLIESTVGIESDKEFIRFSVEKVFAQMQKQSSFTRIRLNWLEKRKKGFENIKRWDANICLEIPKAFEAIKRELSATDLLKNHYVYGCVSAVERVLLHKDENCFALAYAEIENLLSVLLEFGADEIVAKYAKIRVSRAFVTNMFTGKIQPHEKYIRKNCISESIIKKRNFINVFRKSEIEDSWVALEILYLLENLWNGSEPSQDESIFHDYWTELDELKKGEDHVLFFFDRNKIVSCLKVLAKEMFYGEEISFGQCSDMKSCTLSLYLFESGKGCKLFLQVTDILATDTYVVHEFKNRTFAPFRVTKKLFDKGRANVTKDTKFTGVSNFRQRVELDNVLGDVFFEFDGSCAKLKRHFVACSSLSLTELKKIQEHLKELKADGRKKK